MANQAIKRSVQVDKESDKRQAVRRTDECARCGRTCHLDMFAVHTVAGPVRAALCAPCASWHRDTSAPLHVLDIADEEDGLPLLADQMTETQRLGTFVDHMPPRCLFCASRALVVKCHPLHWGSATANTGIKLHLCDECRRCDECGDSAQRGDGIDVTVGGERTCERCAMWCEWCEAFFPGGDGEEIGDHFQKKAFDGEGKPLCKRQCAYCQEDDAVVAHPRSDRRYCRRCVLADNWVDAQMNGDFGSDEKGWHKMKKMIALC